MFDDLLDVYVFLWLVGHLVLFGIYYSEYYDRLPKFLRFFDKED